MFTLTRNAWIGLGAVVAAIGGLLYWRHEKQEVHAGPGAAASPHVTDVGSWIDNANYRDTAGKSWSVYDPTVPGTLLTSWTGLSLSYPGETVTAATKADLAMAIDARAAKGSALPGGAIPGADAIPTGMVDWQKAGYGLGLAAGMKDKTIGTIQMKPEAPAAEMAKAGDPVAFNAGYVAGYNIGVGAVVAGIQTGRWHGNAFLPDYWHSVRGQ